MIRRSGAAWAFSALILTSAALTSSLVGCDRAREKAPGVDAKILFIGPTAYNPRWPAMQGGVRRLARELTMTQFELLSPKSQSEAHLLDAAQAAIDRKVTAACFFVADPRVTKAAVDKLIRSGVLVVTVDEAIPDLTVYGHVQVDWAGGAELLGRNLNLLAAGKHSYLLLSDQGRGGVEANCYLRFQQEARGNSLMTLLEERDGTHSRASTSAQVEQMTRQFRHAGLVVTLLPDPWLESPPRLLLGEETRFATLSAAPALWRWLRSGEASGLVGPIDGEISYLAMQLALDGLMGSRTSSRNRVVPCELVTRSNLADFARRYAQAGDLNLEFLLPGEATTSPTSRP